MPAVQPRPNSPQTNPSALQPASPAPQPGATNAALRGSNYAQGRQIVSPNPGAQPGDVVAGWVIYPGEARTGGSLAWRNNNPGNIRAGRFAEAHGAFPGKSNKGFAIFASEEEGFAAIIDLLKEPLYASKTVQEAIRTYAPAADNNDPVAYAAYVQNMTGVAATAVLNTLSDAELQGIAGAIKKMEGTIVGTSVARQDPQLPPAARLPVR